jgi:dipeptidyl aminopeptidase/acylaminoacyl peptidase
MQRRLLLAFGLLLAAVALAQHGAAQERRIQPTDLFSIHELGSVALSPDGRQVAYTVRQVVADPEREGRHTYRTNIWLGASDGAVPPRQVTHSEAGASSPVWHPGGTEIAFARTIDGKSQVYLLPLHGGEARRISDLPEGASPLGFSPDGRSLLVASTIPFAGIDAPRGPPWPIERPAREPGDVEHREAMPDGDPDEVRAFLDGQPSAIVEVTTRLSFQGEHRLNPDPEFRHLFVVPIAASPTGVIPEARRLTRGYVSHAGGAWTPDGRHVLASIPADTTVHPDRVPNAQLVRIATADGAVEPLLILDGWTVHSPEVSPDGRHVAFSAARLDQLGFQENQVGLLELTTGNVTWLTEELDRSAGAVRFAPDGQSVYLVAPTDGGFPLYRIGVADGTITRLTDLQTGIRSYDVAGDRLAFVLTSIDNPFELFVGDLNARDHRQLTRHNADWLAAKEISRPSHRTLTRVIERPGATDEVFEMDYWVMEPIGRRPGERYPILLQIHGGPSAMWGPGEASMWHEFQVFTARGFGVVYANPRGSGGYGFNFRYANFQDWGTGPTADVLAALDAAIAAEEWIDPDRQVVTGGSYAGYLTAWIVAHTDRFRAAVAQRGVYDLGTFLGEGNAWRLVLYHFGGYPWEEEIRPVLEANSPINFAHRITTPLLIKHGSQDLRTGVIQSEMLYRTLKVLERPVEYVRYPGAGHDLSRTGDPDQRLDRILRIYEFLQRHTAAN